VTLLPECLDDYVAEENPVRVVDVFVDELDLGALGLKVLIQLQRGAWLLTSKPSPTFAKTTAKPFAASAVSS